MVSELVPLTVTAMLKTGSESVPAGFVPKKQFSRILPPSVSN